MHAEQADPCLLSNRNDRAMGQSSTDFLKLYEEFIKNFVYTFTYFPTTNWQRAFSPTVYFGCNVEDMPTEQHVVSKVGSYGKQINCILDAMSVLVARVDRHLLSPRERQAVEAFESLARSADEAAADFQNRRRGQVTLDDIDRIVEQLQALRGKDDERYRNLVERLAAGLGVSARQ